MTTTSTRILTQVQDLIDDTARRSVHPQAGVENPDEIARALADAGFLITEDVITIPRTDLPKVKEDAYGVTARGIDASKHAFPPLLRAKAYAFLAMAEHLEKNPPIDEAEVDALAERVRKVGDLGNRLTLRDIRDLVQAGVRAPKEADK